MIFKRKSNIFFLLLLVLFVYFSSNKVMYAYFIDTDFIRNTFVAGDLVNDLTDDFVLREHEALDSNKDGIYELGSNEVLSNTYNVYPDVDIPKDPFVRIGSLNDKAYLYVEVVGESNDDFNWSLNHNWLETNLEGKKGGTIYVYKGASTEAVVLTKDTVNNLVVYILEGIDGSENGGVVISENFSTENALNLSFYGYLVQANGFKDYVDAFESSF